MIAARVSAHDLRARLAACAKSRCALLFSTDQKARRLTVDPPTARDGGRHGVHQHDGRVQAILLMGAALNWLGAAKLFMEALLADD